MSSSFRYQYVQNATGAAITDPNAFPVLTDGDDKQTKFIKHVLSAADIGNGVGQTGHAAGLILAVLPKNYDVRWIQGLSYRPTLTGGINQYQLIDNATVAGPSNIKPVYELYSDGTIRVVDSNYATAAARLAAGDVITAMVVIGTKQDIRDVMQ